MAIDSLNKAKCLLQEKNVDPSLAIYYYNYLIKENIYTKTKYFNGIKKLIKGNPIQYIIGNVNFYGNIIKVNKNVLIPRFETELLIEKTIKHIIKIFGNDKINVADLGTGSGCIAITIKKLLPNINIYAYDISKRALKLAKENAKLNNINISFINYDITNPLPYSYDVIISNPPYLDEKEEVMDIVKNNEPHIALYAKNKGLYYYEKILENFRKQNKKKYLIAFEIGQNQGNEIKKMAQKYLNNPIIEIEKDYSDKNRFVFIYKNE